MEEKECHLQKFKLHKQISHFGKKKWPRSQRAFVKLKVKEITVTAKMLSKNCLLRNGTAPS